MGRHRGLGARRARGAALPVQAAGARLRRERRVPDPRRRVDARRRDHRHALHGRQRDDRGDALQRATRRSRRRTCERIASDASAICNPLQIRDIIRVITPSAAGVRRAAADLAAAVEPDQGDLRGPDDAARHGLDQGRRDRDRRRETSRRCARSCPTRTATGLRAYVTGEAGFAADQSAALEGIDETLLAVTLALVIVLLGVIYRSPIVALVPVFVVGIAYLVAAALVYAGAKAGLYQATGQATAILIVLMFGAGTDYCLLLLVALPRGARQAGRDGDRAAAHGARDRLGGRDRGRGDARAERSPTTTRRAGWARCSRSAWRSPCSPGVTLLPGDARRARDRPRSSARRRRCGRASARSSRHAPPRSPSPSLAILVAGALGNLKRQRHAGLQRAVPHAAGVRPGPRAPAGEVPARPGGAGRRAHRRERRRPRRCRGSTPPRRSPRSTSTGSARTAASRSCASRSARTRSPSRRRTTIPQVREIARRYDPRSARRRPDGRDPRLDGRPRQPTPARSSRSRSRWSS